MSASNLILVCDRKMLEHDAGPGHPERPQRLESLLKLAEQCRGEDVAMQRPRPAARETLELVHAPSYLDLLDSLAGCSRQLDPDTAVSPGSVVAAHLAAGAAIDAVEAVTANPSMRAIALVRPPGHHAESSRAMGFCLLNNIAIAAAHAIEALGIQRVLIVDWDVHHGNGTQHAFYDRDDVLFFSSHQWPFYPGTGALSEVGERAGCGFTVNAPLPAGFDDAGYIALFERVLVPIAEAFQPQLVLVSAGFDAHCDDPLGGMTMSAEGFGALCTIVRGIADRLARRRLALILEGGYHLAALTDSMRACIQTLRGGPPGGPFAPPNADSGRVIQQIHDFHRSHWPILESSAP